MELVLRLYQLVDFYLFPNLILLVGNDDFIKHDYFGKGCRKFRGRRNDQDANGAEEQAEVLCGQYALVQGFMSLFIPIEQRKAVINVIDVLVDDLALCSDGQAHQAAADDRREEEAFVPSRAEGTLIVFV